MVFIIKYKRNERKLRNINEYESESKQSFKHNNFFNLKKEEIRTEYICDTGVCNIKGFFIG